jgi:hypothetical protein
MLEEESVHVRDAGGSMIEEEFDSPRAIVTHTALQHAFTRSIEEAVYPNTSAPRAVAV